MVLTKFEDIKAWQLARETTSSIYLLTQHKEFRKDYGLKDQIQRASVSVMLNIAEGFDSGTNQSFVNFLRYSIRSLSEIRSCMYIALDLNYISEDEFNNINNKLTTIRNMLGGLTRYLKDSSKL